MSTLNVAIQLDTKQLPRTPDNTEFSIRLNEETAAMEEVIRFILANFRLNEMELAERMSLYDLLMAPPSTTEAGDNDWKEYLAEVSIFDTLIMQLREQIAHHLTHLGIIGEPWPTMHLLRLTGDTIYIAIEAVKRN